MTELKLPSSIHLGFLTVFPEGAGFLGGYLVTNSWGRPVEFRLSTAVQPNKVQQILYGHTLTEYLCAELIGKTLVEKTATPVQLLVTDNLSVLPIRTRLDIPTILVRSEDGVSESGLDVPMIRLDHQRSSLPLWWREDHRADDELIRAILDRVDPALELTEPFTRIREAMTEARKMGATSRAA
ncbi:hypothetical protein [Zavarzinella formosa]|uniref:hypothetical protein n=1 Tax=Zavarzinella formosa TaxID=360055 RepID=UPI0002F99EFC|nr:hypothetical protein [Zavarzinella formosa]